MRHGLKLAYGITGWRLWLTVTLGILGFGAIHELIEYFSTLAMGPERGMLKTLADDPYDTQKDLLNNLLGTQLTADRFSGMEHEAAKTRSQSFSITRFATKGMMSRWFACPVVKMTSTNFRPSDNST
ncbi:MAG TPA: hypothetical protein VK846_11410 [Candidatus Limnocylindria bacterium]|nr:hypothetical protein [Candidatus Limnocylindria bacterium]